jgi:nucleotide-binding universal stress UspA family protein
LVWALTEAAFRRSVLEAVIVWQSPYDFGQPLYYPVDEAKLAESARERLTEALAEVPGAKAAVEIEPIVLEGDPAEALCRRSAEADLVVVGSRGHGTFAGLLLGSVSSKCAHHSRSPLMIIPSRYRGDPAPSVAATGRILVGVDGSAGSRRALRWAIDEADLRGATVIALTVWRGIEANDDMALELASFPSIGRRDRAMAEMARERLEQAVSDTVGESGVGIEPVVLEGDPAEALCRRSAEADLVVVGSRGHGTFTGLLLGSVSAKCAHHSPCPTVIVPTDRDKRASTTQAGA